MASDPAPQESRSRFSATALGCYRLAASVKLAVVLIVVLAVVLALATFFEKGRGHEYTAWHVYHSGWFITLLAMIAVNIVAATLFRFPWGLRRLGFLICHVGVLVLLAGAVETFWSGEEGHLVLIENGKPVHEISRDDRCQLTVGWPGQSDQTVLSFNPGPSDWPSGETRTMGDVDGVSLTALKFFRHAQAKEEQPGHAIRGVTYVSVDAADNDDAQSADAAILVRVGVGPSSEDTWLEKTDKDDPAFHLRRLSTPKGPLELSFTSEQTPLDSSIRLLAFSRGLNPGGMGNASFASSVEVVDQDRGISEKREISMNEPLTFGRFTFYQSSFFNLPDGRNASVLTAACDPGRWLKYAGSVLTCAGMLIVFVLSMTATFRGWVSAGRDRTELTSAAGTRTPGPRHAEGG
jgi:hypothetical protein